MADNFCLSTQSPWLQSFDHGVSDDQDICIDDRLRGRGLHFLADWRFGFSSVEFPVFSTIMVKLFLKGGAFFF